MMAMTRDLRCGSQSVPTSSPAGRTARVLPSRSGLPEISFVWLTAFGTSLRAHGIDVAAGAIDPQAGFIQFREHPWYLTLMAVLALLSLTMLLGFLWRHQKAAYFRLLYEKEIARESIERKYGHLFRRARDIILIADEDGRILEANDAACQAYGRSEAELLAMTVPELCSPEARADWQAHWRETDRLPEKLYATSHLRADPSPFPVEISSTRLERAGGNSWLMIIRDITERTRAEEALRETTHTLEVALEAAQMGAWDVDLVNDTSVRTPRHDMIFGYSSPQAEWNRRIFLEHVAPEDRHRFESLIHADTVENGSFSSEFRTVWPDGSLHWVADRGRIQLDASGRPVRIAGVIQDITERKRAEEALRRSEDRFRSLVEKSRDWIWETDADGRLTYSSPKVREYLGYDPEQIIGQYPLDLFVSPEERKLVSQSAAALRMQGQGFSDFGVTCTAKDGRKVELEIDGTLILDAAGNMSGVRGIARDVTERKRAQEAIHESERRFRMVVSNIPDVVWAMDRRDHFSLITGNVERMTGRTAEEFYQQGPDLWFRCVHPEDLSSATAAYEALLAASPGHKLEYRIRNKRGSWKWVQARAMTYEDLGVRCLMGLLTDITERKRAEEEQANSNRELRRLSIQLLKAQDSERRQLARELHDGTAQLIAGISLNLFRLRDLAAGPMRERLVTESIELARQCSSEVRTISYGLHPPLLDELGLASAIRAFAQGFESRSGIKIDTQITLGSEGLGKDMELALFRIVQEAIVNVHRHSGSPRAVIVLERDAAQVSLRIQDFGSSAEPRDLSSMEQGSVGVGILGMRERSAQFGGRMTLTSTPDGTTVTVTLPLENFDEEDPSTDCR